MQSNTPLLRPHEPDKTHDQISQQFQHQQMIQQQIQEVHEQSKKGHHPEREQEELRLEELSQMGQTNGERQQDQQVLNGEHLVEFTPFIQEVLNVLNQSEPPAQGSTYFQK